MYMDTYCQASAAMHPGLNTPQASSFCMAVGCRSCPLGLAEVHTLLALDHAACPSAPTTPPAPACLPAHHRRSGGAGTCSCCSTSTTTWAWPPSRPGRAAAAPTTATTAAAATSPGAHRAHACMHLLHAPAASTTLVGSACMRCH